MDTIKHSSKAICILGMHRSGTSTITRALNLLGVSLGDGGLMPPSPEDNPEGFWERLDIEDVHKRLLVKLGRRWATSAPLPEDWHKAKDILVFKNELRELIAKNFAGKDLWGWKDPRTCLLFPLWRELLQEAGIQPRCLFVLRSPLEVAGSLLKRDKLPLNRALDVWFNYYISALKETAGLPCTFISYDRFLRSWEGELRKCAEQLEIAWPTEESFYSEMNSFIKPGLRHHRATDTELQKIPRRVRELYELLTGACVRSTGRDARFDAVVQRLYDELSGYASFFAGMDYAQRTLQRWRRSVQKRLRPNTAL